MKTDQYFKENAIWNGIILMNPKELMDGYLDHIINNPQTGDFIKALKAEMEHQKGRWGDESDCYPHHFALVINMLAGKLIKSMFDKDSTKFEHHLITLAAECGTAHKYFMDSESQTNKYFKQEG